MYEEVVVTEWIRQKWVVKFHARTFSLDLFIWLDRPVEVNSDEIKTLTENNQSCTMWGIAKILKISKSSTENHLYQLCYVNHFDAWVLYKLNGKKNLLDYISSWDSLPKHNKSIPFPKQIVMGNEKLILTVMWNGKDHRASEMNHHQPHQRLVSNQRKWCMCGRIRRESSIMSSFWKIKLLIPTSTDPSQVNWSHTQWKVSRINQQIKA